MRGLSPADEGAVGFLKGRECLRNVIVPGELLFIHQRPKQTDTAGAEAEARAQCAHDAIAPSRLESVEIDQAQPSPAHAGSFAAGPNPEHTVEHGERGDDANVERNCVPVEAKHSAHQVEREQKKAETY